MIDVLAILRRWRYRLLAIAILLLLAVAAGVLNVGLKLRKLDSAYEAIRIGDSRERLVELLGPPPIVGNSAEPARPYALSIDCEDFRYGYLYQTWYYAFDRNGKLVQKVRCVLGEYCTKGDQ